MIYLNEVSVGKRVRLSKLGGEGEVHRRLVDMGMIPGAIVGVERIAPFGDPIDIRLKGFHLSLRKAEAALVQVSEIEEVRK